MELVYGNKGIYLFPGSPDYSLNAKISVLEYFEHAGEDDPKYEKLLSIEASTTTDSVYVKTDKLYVIESRQINERLKNMIREMINLIELGRLNEVPEVIERETENIKTILEEEKRDFEKIFNKIVEKLNNLATVLSTNIIKR